MTGERSDRVEKNWTVDVSIDEHKGLTRAKARLRVREKEAVGTGTSRLDPYDRDVAEIGDELAVGRALSDLARRLLAVAAQDIESVTLAPATFRN